MKTQWLGLTSYKSALEAQKTFSDIILGLEHPATITLGKRGRVHNYNGVQGDLRATTEELSHQGIEIAEIDRGGQATLHSPGQLVIYPLLDLRERSLSVREYVELLTRTTQDLLNEFSIQTCSKESPGLYTDQGKIAFFGVRVSRGLTSHGLSLNVCNDLALFRSIRSCGVESETFDKMSNHSVDAQLKELFFKWCELFHKRLSLTQTFVRPNLELSATTVRV